MFSSLILSYSGQFFIAPVPTFAFCDLGSVAGALVCEDQGKEAIDELSLLPVLGSQVSRFAPERARIFPGLSFITDLLFLLPWPILILSGLLSAFLTRFLAVWAISVFLPGYLFLHPPSVGFLFVFIQELPVHPYKPPVIFA